MKIAISSTGKNLESNIDKRFGRAPMFIIFDTENSTFEVWENANLAGAHGVGTKTAQEIANFGVKIVISGNVGPNALNVLKAAGIEIFKADSGTVQEALEKHQNNETIKMDKATKKGH